MGGKIGKTICQITIPLTFEEFGELFFHFKSDKKSQACTGSIKSANRKRFDRLTLLAKSIKGFHEVVKPEIGALLNHPTIYKLNFGQCLSKKHLRGLYFFDL